MSVVVNNAGVVSGSNFLESSDLKNQLTMDVNCMAHLWVTKAFLPDMIKFREGNLARCASVCRWVAQLHNRAWVLGATLRRAGTGR